MMKYYPMNLNIKDKLGVVIGGGKVAERKVKNLLRCGGRVRVVSPELTNLLSKWASQGKMDFTRSEYRASHLKGAFLVYAATSDRKVNARIARDAARRKLLVNVADSATESTFILPAVLRNRKISIAVSTNGVSPATSVRIRDRIKKFIEKERLAKAER
ncbi:MAG TPA: bifunctional precorrin-2 dehydrogenase/sirohydrochlorin ferrochelatase [Thermodesulfobacteriota bacterium]|nr:bifunctional precorrin-2 dehydrogenase/sirohydrochlorin ferrochelatase [Thermodesulfobacteriota bacterium]